MDAWDGWAESERSTEVSGLAGATPGRRSPEAESEGVAASGALDQYLAALRDLPLLEPEQINRLSAEIRDEEARFREALATVPGTALLLVERWEERRAQGRVTGLLSHHYRDQPDTDWTAFIDERLHLLSELCSRRAKLPPPARPARREALEREIGEVLRSAEIQLELLLEIALELRGLLDMPRTRAVVARRRELGLVGRGARSALLRAERAVERRDRARRTLASHNLRLVVHVAKRYRGQGVPFLDLIQEGSIGLLRAVDKFDATLGFRFSTYAVWWVEQAVIRAIQKDSRTVRVPSHVYDAQLKLRSAEGRLGTCLSNPSASDLAAALGVSRDQIDRVASSSLRIHSLDVSPDDPEGTRLGERLRDPTSRDPAEDVDLERARAVFERELGGLDARERAVLAWRFGLADEEELNLRQIGDRLGLSRERVRQIQNEALEKLSRRSDVTALRDMLTPDLAHG